MGKILLVEDDGLITKDLSDKLKDFDYEVQTAYSYVSAIDCWEKHKGNFDCIILDLNIDPSNLDPKKSSKYIPICGMAFLEDILNGEYNPEIRGVKKESITKLDDLKKVIIYSGFIETLTQRKCNFKCYDQLTQPIFKSTINMENLINEVERIINK